jgi:thioredoxin reductase
MQVWQEQMPAGMLLKSEGFASNLHDPASENTLAAYCSRHSLPYQNVGLPVPLETFSSYGTDFQRRLVPDLEKSHISSLEKIAGRFRLSLDNDEYLWADRVIVATGISNFEYLPQNLEEHSGAFVSHSSAHRDLSKFKGRQVTVLGAGASALDLAGLLHDAGASVQLFARSPRIHFHQPPVTRTAIDRIRAPLTGLGPGWRSLLCTSAPLLFHLAPERLRVEIVKRHLGPAPGWFSRDKVGGNVPLNVGQSLQSLRIQGGRVHTTFSGLDGSKRETTADHLIAATGYRVNLSRLPFLSTALRHAIRTADGSPALTSSFESSVPGLYFIGKAAAVSFGPLLRFVYGAQFASTRLSRHLIASRPRRRVFLRSNPKPV